MIRLSTALVTLLPVVMTITLFLPAIERRPRPIEPPSATSIAPFACLCDRNRFRCDWFETQEDAQECFDLCVSQGAGDIHGLDDDKDGVACEELPAGFRIVR
jgi:hypothetical protein